MTSEDIDTRYFVETAARAFDCLHAVESFDEPAPLSAIVAKLKWNKPTVYRFVRTLEAIGMLRQEDGGYVLGSALISLGQSALRGTRLVDAARSPLQALFEQTDETVILAILERDQVIYTNRFEAHQLLVPRAMGSRAPAYCTSTGQVLLAALTDADVRKRLEGCSFEKLAPRTITSLDALLERLDKIRSDGFAVIDDELTVGHRAAAAPVRDHTGQVCAAVGISVVAARVSRRRLSEFVAAFLLPTAAAISSNLGAGFESPGRG